MKTLMLATAAVLGIGIGAAYADGEDGGTIPNTWFSELPGEISTPPGQAPNNVAAQDRYGPSVAGYGTDQNNAASAMPRQSNGG